MTNVSPSIADERRKVVFSEAQTRIAAALGESAAVGPGAEPETTPAAAAGTKRRRAPESDTSDANSSPLTLDEEQRLLRAYEGRVLDLCADLGFGPAVAATAATYFRRFYVVRSPRDVLPVDALHTAIFLAIKTEACPYTEVPTFSRRLAQACALCCALDRGYCGLQPCPYPHRSGPL